MAKDRESGYKASGAELSNISGTKPDEITDDIESYYLPNITKGRVSEIEELRSFDDFKEYFADRGIELTTDLESLSGRRSGDDIRAVREECQKIAVAVDAYRDMFGSDALSKLKRINLYDETLDTRAAYHFNRIGEDDPYAGTIRFRQWDDDGRTIFHELAHAFQDSQARRGEDAVSYAERMVKEAKLPDSFSAYTGAASDVYDAERFADAFGYGFSKGNKEGLNFIRNVKKRMKK